MDNVSPATRSRIMSSVRSSRTGPERKLWSALRRARVKFRRNAPDLPGSPDAAIDSARVAVFVHGCFWHGCRRCYRAPKSNRAFWRGKLVANRRRDARATRALNRMGWSVVTAWEHDAADGYAGAVRRVLRAMFHVEHRGRPA